MFHHSFLIQQFLDTIFNEGRLSEVIDICDMYHNTFNTPKEALEWGINVGTYVGKYKFGDKIWKFDCPNDDVSLYFFGSFDEVYKKVHEAL